MKQIIVELDDELAARLERVAPSRARRRSIFIREALRRALDEALERKTAEAYRLHPPTEMAEYFDPAEWGVAARPPRRSTRSRKRRSA
ncbi:MAG: hypothetical protein HYY06_32915 [Deltaproteobacteria bacterium]|nr:hypothetical protein [Deltaproteobacteria bacterium]